MKKFEELKTLIASLEADADKFYNKGNSAAGTRIRKGMLRSLLTFTMAVALSISVSAAEEDSVITYSTDTDISYLEKGKEATPIA